MRTVDLNPGEFTASEKTLVQQRTATTEECAKALRQLGAANWRRLDEMARLRALGLKHFEGRDLLHDAIVRMLEGKRKWPLDVPLVVFLRETMRSIASDLWRRQQDSVEISETDTRSYQEDGDGVIAMTADTSIDLEAKVGAEQIFAQIKDLFKDDKQVLAVIAGKINGKSPGEIQQETEMSATQYATTQRRIRRRLIKFSESKVMK